MSSQTKRMQSHIDSTAQNSVHTRKQKTSAKANREQSHVIKIQIRAICPSDSISVAQNKNVLVDILESASLILMLSTFVMLEAMPTKTQNNNAKR